MAHDLDEIIRRIAESDSVEEAVAAGLLFHGTCEDFYLPPRGGAYDGLVWTTDTPAIAQSYIPRAGAQVLVSDPGGFRLRDKVRPDPHSAWTDIVRQMGHVPIDVDVDANGTLASWRVPRDWPTYGEALDYLKGLRYDFSGGSAWVSMRTSPDGRHEYMPAGWSMPGRLLVTLRDGLNLRDLRRGSEGDLTDVDYHDHEGFGRARAAGRDGVVINDFAQTKSWGNFGHVSYGIFPEVAARLPWLEIPARHFDWPDGFGRGVSPEFEAYRDEVAADAAPRP